jgi:hypothetical protein
MKLPGEIQGTRGDNHEQRQCQGHFCKRKATLL